MKIGSEIMIEEHLQGRAYMIFVTNINHQKVNIGNLGSGHYYMIRLILLLFQKINEGNLERMKNSDNEWRKRLSEGDRIIMVLTEPEANLHPNLQSSLCNLLVQFTRDYNINFLIETHSEYLIRNLQLNVAQKNILNNECKLYFLENKDNSTQIRRIRLDKNGLLMDKFGTGFLDESQKMIEELLKVKQN